MINDPRDSSAASGLDNIAIVNESIREADATLAAMRASLAGVKKKTLPMSKSSSAPSTQDNIADEDGGDLDKDLDEDGDVTMKGAPSECNTLYFANDG